MLAKLGKPALGSPLKLKLTRVSNSPANFAAKSPVNAKVKSSAKPPENSQASKADDSAASATTDLHKNEGFLKNAWHKLIQQRKGPAQEAPPAQKGSEEKVDDEEPKRAAGSG